jgi:hypothetical protein
MKLPELEPGKSPVLTLTELHAKYVKGPGSEPSVNMMVNVLNIASALKTAWSLCEYDLAQGQQAVHNTQARMKELEQKPMDPAFFAFADLAFDVTEAYNAARIAKARIQADIKTFVKACAAPEVKDSAEPILANFPFLVQPNAPAPMGGAV